MNISDRTRACLCFSLSFRGQKKKKEASWFPGLTKKLRHKLCKVRHKDMVNKLQPSSRFWSAVQTWIQKSAGTTDTKGLLAFDIFNQNMTWLYNA